MARTLLIKPFDRDHDFVTRRPITIEGQPFVPGEHFEKNLVSTRRLRQLFDAGVIRVAGEASVPFRDPYPFEAQPAKQARPLDRMGRDELRAQALGLGIVADRRWGSKRLIEEIRAHG